MNLDELMERLVALQERGFGDLGLSSLADRLVAEAEEAADAYEADECAALPSAEAMARALGLVA